MFIFNNVTLLFVCLTLVVNPGVGRPAYFTENELREFKYQYQVLDTRSKDIKAFLRDKLTEKRHS